MATSCFTKEQRLEFVRMWKKARQRGMTRREFTDANELVFDTFRSWEKELRIGNLDFTKRNVLIKDTTYDALTKWCVKNKTDQNKAIEFALAKMLKLV